MTEAAPTPAARGLLDRADAWAGVVVVAVVVLLGAPAGLLWASVAPRVPVLLTEAGPSFDQYTPDFIAADASYVLLVLVLGALTGGLAWLLARRDGPGVVLGLLIGGLLAAYVAARVGQVVGRSAFEAALADSARRGTVEAAVRLRSGQARLAWPAAALLAYAVLTAAERRETETSRPPGTLSSG